MNHKISVVVPCYNLNDYIEECIESILKQTYGNLEIIVVDDGSNDGSIDRILPFIAKDDRVILKQQKNKGSSVARNKGVDLATGDYIIFIDGDDFISDDYIEELYNVAVKSNVVVAVNHTYTKYFSTNKEEEVENYNPNAFVLNLIDHCPWNKIYNLSFLKNTGVKFLEGIKHQDYLFWNQLIAHLDKVAFVSKGNYYYRQSNNSVMRSKVTLYKRDIIICIESLYKYYSENKNNLNFKPINIWLVNHHLKQLPFKYRVKFIVQVRGLFKTFDKGFLKLFNRRSYRVYKSYINYTILFKMFN